MQMTQYEQEMLEGAHGEAKKFAMTVLSKLGKVYGADRFVEVASAQIMAHYGSLHDAGLELAERFVSMGGTFCIPTTEDRFGFISAMARVGHRRRILQEAKTSGSGHYQARGPACLDLHSLLCG